jgi:hypothetical protein
VLSCTDSAKTCKSPRNNTLIQVKCVFMMVCGQSHVNVIVKEIRPETVALLPRGKVITKARIFVFGVHSRPPTHA